MLQKKAERILNEKRISITYRNGTNVHFKIDGKDEHSVIRNRKGYICDCYYFSIMCKPCSHIKAAKMMMNEDETQKIKMD